MHRYVAFCIVIISALSSAGGASSQNAGQKTAALDMAKIFTEAKAVQQIQRQLKAKGDNFQKELDALETNARQEAEMLEKEKDGLANIAVTKRQEDIQKKVVSFQTLAISRKEQVDKAYMSAMDKVKEAFQEVLGDVAKSKGIAMVVPLQQIVYMDKNLALDITDEVMEKLNKKLPTVTVVIPKKPKGS